jgi:tetratricopeptide (TPR) repeat protein
MRTRISVLYVLSGAILGATPDFHQMMHLGQAALAAADIPAAEKFFLQACGKTADTEPSAGPFTPDMQASCEHHLAIVDQARGDLPGAESRLLRALPEWQQAGSGFLPSYAMSMMNLGELYRLQRRTGETEDCLSRSVQLAREVRPAYPQIYPEALSRLGGAYAEFDKPAEGRPLLTEALDAFRSLEPRRQAAEARVLNTLGFMDLLEGHTAQALSLLNEAVRLAMTELGENHLEVATYQSDLAFAYVRSGQYDRAEPLLNRARFVIESHPVHDSLRLGIIFTELSLIACNRNKPALAEEYSNRAQQILDTLPSQKRVTGLLARVGLGAAWLAQHRLAEAERLLPDTVAVERRVAPHSYLLADGIHTLASLRALQHSWREAADLYKESIEIYRNRVGWNNPAIAPVLKEYADALKHSGGSKEEAKRMEALAKAISGSLPPG